jgi:fructose-1,6-bisphosphatase
MSTTNKFKARFGLDNNNNTITNVDTPVNGTDAANKSYVDAAATLADTGVTAGSYGSSTTIPVLTISSTGLVTAASTIDVAATSGGGGIASSDAKNFFFN